jgi:hypothetical protein
MMDLDRIERALREGPPDEPRYTPGIFARGRGPLLSMAAAASILAAAVVTGLAIGIGLDVLRAPGSDVGGPTDIALLQRQLEGEWTSREISREEFISGLVEQGHEIDDVNSFLKPPEPAIERTVRFRLAFQTRELLIERSVDGKAWGQVAAGPYQVLPDGTVWYEDLGCIVTARFTVSEEALAFDRIGTQHCGAIERVANSAFFNLSTYTRTGY